MWDRFWLFSDLEFIVAHRAGPDPTDVSPLTFYVLFSSALAPTGGLSETPVAATMLNIQSSSLALTPSVRMINSTLFQVNLTGMQRDTGTVTVQLSPGLVQNTYGQLNEKSVSTRNQVLF